MTDNRRSTSSLRRRRVLISSAAVAAIFPMMGTDPALGQIATLDKGHTLLVNNGLQIWGLVTDSSSQLNYPNMSAGNFTAVTWSFGQSNPGALSTGQKWGKWVDPNTNPSTALNATEQAHVNDLVTLQVGDEQQSDLENPSSVTAQWFQTAHANNLFQNQLLSVNSFYISSDAGYASFIGSANPDAISWDGYPFSSPAGTLITPQNWLVNANHFRRHGLGSYIGATSNAPRPYGMYIQTYHGGDGARDPGDVEMRWQQFTAWTMGYKFVNAFTAGGGNTSLFREGNQNLPMDGSDPLQSPARYTWFKETARQGRNLGPALTRLISYGYGPSAIPGKDASGNPNSVPGDWLAFNKTNAPPSQQYLTSVSAVNIGTKNGGQPGDVYVGFFNPLHASYGDPTGEAYFMVTNALGAYLDDATATVAQCAQQLTLNFDFGGSGITSLQRLSRDTGQVETINTSYTDGGNTVFTALGGSLYRLQLKLDGGTGDLFKYNDGSPFVGVQPPFVTMYWDADGVSAGNDTSTGAGLGGAGTWSAGGKWYNGAANVSWAHGSSAVFWGPIGGNVTLLSGVTANSLNFKTTGYTLAGSGIVLSGPTVTADAGVTASINAALSGAAGLIKEGAGTVNLGAANTYSGGTTINGGVLGIVSSALGATPGAPVVNISINNGATLRFNTNNLTLAVNRQVMLGAGGGVIDTNGNNSTIAGVVMGSGAITKTGAGTLALTNSNTYSGITTVNGGSLKISADANLGAVPATLADNVSLDGGTLLFGGTFDPASTRGIVLGASGGTIETPGTFGTSAGYSAVNGFRGAGNLTKTGTGSFYASATTVNTGWTGNLVLKEGIWKVQATGGLPVNPSTGGLRPGQVTFDGGTLQFNASLFGSQSNRGWTVNAGGGTIDTQGFNVTWAGPISGTSSSATLTKSGSGLLRMNYTSPNSSTYQGTLRVSEGTVQLDGGQSMGNLASLVLDDVAGVTLNVTGSETIGSLAGGGANGGNVTLGVINMSTGGNDASTTFAGTISGGGGITKQGAGTMVLSGASTYTAGTTVSAGTLQLGNGGTSGSILGNVTNNATLRFSRSGTATFSGNISGSGAVTHAGPGILVATGSNTYAGLTTISGGGTLVAGPSNLGNGGVGNNIVLDNGTLRTSAAISSNRKITLGAGGGTIDSNGFDSSFGDVDPGNFTKNGSGQVSLRSLDALAVSINSGKLAIKTRAQTGGNKTARMLSVSIAPSATLDLNDNDLVVSYGTNASPFTTINNEIINGLGADAGNIISSTGRGAGNTIHYAIDNGGGVGLSEWPIGSGVSIDSNSVIAKYTYFGDVNLDGVVNDGDYGIIDANYQTAPPANVAVISGDANLDGVVNDSDYGIIDANYLAGSGNPLTPAANSPQAIPEPLHLSLALLGAASLTLRRRRPIPN